MKNFLTIILNILFITTIMFSGCITEEKPQPTINDGLPTNPEDRSVILIQYLDEGDYDTVYNEFNMTVKSLFPRADLQTAWESLILNYGKLGKIETTYLTEEQNYTVVYVACNFSKLGLLDLRFVYDDEGLIAGFQFTPHQTHETWTAPDYTEPGEFVETNYSIGVEPYILPGTLTTPAGEGPFAVILMLSGSGPNDRDETIYANKPFKDIAWGLATLGIASFRFDKRSLIYGEDFANDLNVTVEEEYLEDAEYAIDFLINLTGKIDQNQIYLLGHSLGGQVAPEVARRDDRIKGVIILASAARDLEDIYYEQIEYLYNLDGNLTEHEQSSLKEILMQVDMINNKTAPLNELILGVYPDYWYYLHTIPPIPISENLTIPMLVMQGERDYQVTPQDNFIIWQETFQGNGRVNLRLYNNLNHLFMYGEGIPNNLEYQILGHVSEDVINDIAYWIFSNHVLPEE